MGRPHGKRAPAPSCDPDNPWIVDLPVDDIVATSSGRFVPASESSDGLSDSSEDAECNSDWSSSVNSHGSRKSRIT